MIWITDQYSNHSLIIIISYISYQNWLFPSVAPLTLLPFFSQWDWSIWAMPDQIKIDMYGIHGQRINWFKRYVHSIIERRPHSNEDRPENLNEKRGVWRLEERGEKPEANQIGKSKSIFTVQMPWSLSVSRLHFLVTWAFGPWHDRHYLSIDDDMDHERALNGIGIVVHICGWWKWPEWSRRSRHWRRYKSEDGKCHQGWSGGLCSKLFPHQNHQPDC